MNLFEMLRLMHNGRRKVGLYGGQTLTTTRHTATITLTNSFIGKVGKMTCPRTQPHYKLGGNQSPTLSTSIISL